MPTLVVVSGPPGAGKTTLARRIAEEARLPLVCRDDLQTTILAGLAEADRTWARRLAAASYGILRHVAGELLRSRASGVVEANFRPAVDRGWLAEIVERFGARTIEVHCRADTDALLDRIRARDVVHPAQFRVIDPVRFHTDLAGGAWAPLELGGDVHLVDTSRDDARIPLLPRRDAPEPTVVFVSGHTGSGKTTLSPRLAVDLGLPLLAKDDIKEILFDTLGTGELAWSRRLGGITFELLHDLIGALVRGGVSLVAEAKWFRGPSTRALGALRERHPFRVVHVRCTAPVDVLVERIRVREGRHPGHHRGAIDRGELAVEAEAPDLDGPIFTVDTSALDDAAYGDLVASVRAAVART